MSQIEPRDAAGGVDTLNCAIFGLNIPYQAADQLVAISRCRYIAARIGIGNHDGAVFAQHFSDQSADRSPGGRDITCRINLIKGDAALDMPDQSADHRDRERRRYVTGGIGPADCASQICRSNKTADILVANHIACGMCDGNVGGVNVVALPPDQPADIVIAADISCGVGIFEASGSQFANQAADIIARTGNTTCGMNPGNRAVPIAYPGQPAVIIARAGNITRGIRIADRASIIGAHQSTEIVAAAAADVAQGMRTDDGRSI